MKILIVESIYEGTHGIKILGIFENMNHIKQCITDIGNSYNSIVGENRLLI